MGATGSGKSQLSMAISQHFPCTIISCDSMQLYRGLDIGTAKPSIEDQQQVPHALIDTITLPDQTNAVAWANLARQAITTARAAHRIPLLVGGTGMYLRALLEGFADIPPEAPAIRQRLYKIQQKHGTPWLHRMLTRLDPITAHRLPAHDSQRIQRALGVRLSSGKPLSHWLQQQPSPALIHCPIFVLDPPHEPLYPHLDARFHTMMQHGWLEEIAWLAHQSLPEDHPASRAVGYRQLLAYHHREWDLDEAIQRGIIATRQYAKRQRTWFRRQTPDAIHGDATKIRQHILQLGAVWI
ncbi:MAG: tRNA (adenosine(37)-N6)-dimethylallyltransferase MiaA [Mariprofundales bacterium]|nr:tRNA (adenosine(37)-N6)-dimethylallyltransferase MiaA [Mariprofundales bacterium]